MSDREIDAKLDAVEARTDTKIGRFEAKLDLAMQKIDGIASEMRGALGAIGNAQAELRAQARSNLQVIVATTVGGLIAVFFGLFAVLQWADSRMFDMIGVRENPKPPVSAAASAPAPGTAPTAAPPAAAPASPKP